MPSRQHTILVAFGCILSSIIKLTRFLWSCTSISPRNDTYLCMLIPILNNDWTTGITPTGVFTTSVHTCKYDDISESCCRWFIAVVVWQCRISVLVLLYLPAQNMLSSYISPLYQAGLLHLVDEI